MPQTYPNQKYITIKKECCDQSNPYSQINLNTLQKAMHNLKGEAFKLWIYLAKNQNHHSFALSQQDAAKWGIGKDGYYRSIEKLIQMGYLRPSEKDKNHFIFSEKRMILAIYFDCNAGCRKEEWTEEDSELSKELKIGIYKIQKS